MRGLGFLLVLFFATSASADAKPHVVLFLADDLGVLDCGPYGGKDVPTPNMDRLAKDGLTFRKAFVSSPSCAPSRAALLTGLDPMRNGAMLNHARPKASLKKWPAYFREQGYEVAAIGKVAHYAQVTEYGFDHASHFKYHEDDCVAEAVKFLEGRKSDKPLCLLVGTNWPHVPWPKESAIKVESLPPTQVDTPETRSARARYLAAVANADRDLGLVRSAAAKALGENVLFAFTSDHGSQFPFGKWNLTDAGVRTPLIVCWPGRIKPGTATDAMVGWIDLLPTLVAATGGDAPKEISGRSFLDVLLGKADRHRDKVFLTHSADGQMNRYPIRGVRTADWKYIRNLDPAAEHHTHVDKGNAGTDGRAYWDSWVAKAKTDPAAAAIVRSYHTRPAEELYDVANDPHELTNLAADPKQADRLKTLRADLDAWMAANGDRGLATERELPNPNAKPKPKD
jgi:N-sulfoglucosamine sulfohydrolase